MKRRRWKYFCYGCAALCLLLCLWVSDGGINLPDTIYLTKGESAELKLPIAVTAKVMTGTGTGIRLNGSRLYKNESVWADGSLSIQADDEISAKIALQLNDAFTLKEIEVCTLENNELYAGGQSIGVAMYTRGALVVSLSEFTDTQGNSVCPGKEAGLMIGDVILKADGQEVKSAEHLSEILSGSTGPVLLGIRRGGEDRRVSITPRPDGTDGEYRMGLWVRDSTAGIGTMTYMDEEKKRFAALGHAITDADLEQILLLRIGEVIPAVIFDVVKGKSGEPGELCGAFIENEPSVGVIEKNTEFGVFGKSSRILINEIYPDPLPFASQSEIRTGEATILSTVDDKGVKEYNCEILRINRQKSPAQKGLVLRITDERLLSATGGIVQGMSGSPIIQNGKIIGAVTHVFVSDPKQGYGIFIEWMLDEAG